MCVFENVLTSKNTTRQLIPQTVSKSSVGQIPHINTVDNSMFSQTSLLIIRKSILSANICRLSIYNLMIISQLVRKKNSDLDFFNNPVSLYRSFSYFVSDTCQRILSSSAMVTESKLNSSVIEVTT